MVHDKEVVPKEAFQNVFLPLGRPSRHRPSSKMTSCGYFKMFECLKSVISHLFTFLNLSFGIHRLISI